MTTTIIPTDTITILQSDTLMAKEVVVGGGSVPVAGEVKMGFLFNVTAWQMAELHDFRALLQDLQHDQYAVAVRGPLIEGRPTEAARLTSHDHIDAPQFPAMPTVMADDRCQRLTPGLLSGLWGDPTQEGE